MEVQSLALKSRVTEALSRVIDPETGVDVMRMRLIEDLVVDARSGFVSYKFRPSSPLCPLAVSLVLSIRQAVAQVPDIAEQQIEVVGYVGAEELNALLMKEA